MNTKNPQENIIISEVKKEDGLPISYDPESMTFNQQYEALIKIYKALYPWHGTPEAQHYSYPHFMVAVQDWANDEFYVQHLLAKLYLSSYNFIFEEPISNLID